MITIKRTLYPVTIGLILAHASVAEYWIGRPGVFALQSGPAAGCPTCSIGANTPVLNSSVKNVISIYGMTLGFQHGQLAYAPSPSLAQPHSAPAAPGVVQPDLGARTTKDQTTQSDPQKEALQGIENRAWSDVFALQYRVLNQQREDNELLDNLDRYIETLRDDGPRASRPSTAYRPDRI